MDGSVIYWKYTRFRRKVLSLILDILGLSCLCNTQERYKVLNCDIKSSDKMSEVEIEVYN